jgi:hypothetical protein
MYSNKWLAATKDVTGYRINYVSTMLLKDSLQAVIPSKLRRDDTEFAAM